MQKLLINILIIAVAGIAFSCKKINNVTLFGNDDKDSTILFEMDSSLMIDDNTFDKSVSIADIPLFSSATLAGSMAYENDFNIDVMILPDADSAYIILSEMYNIDKEGKQMWRLTDYTQVYFPIGSSIGWPGYVVKNGKIDYTLMAIMPEDNDWIDTEVYDNLLGVWHLCTETKSITPMPVDSFACINESYGVY